MIIQQVENSQNILKLFIGLMVVYIFPFFRDEVVQAFILLQLFDYVSGVLVAISRKEISSKKYFYGLCKKIGVLFFVSLHYPLEKTLGIEVKQYIIMTLSIGEGISIVENLGNLGVLNNSAITQYFKQIQNNKGG